MNSNHRVSIIGTGNAALTAAYHLSALNVDVCLYGSPGFAQPLDDIRQAGGIRADATLDGADLDFAGFQAVHTLTDDVAEAAAYADVLLLPVPSFAQLPLFDALLPHLRDEQIIMLLPGNFGSLALRRRQHERGYTQRLIFVEAISSPWACRITGPAHIAIMGLKTCLPVAALPSTRTEDAIARLAPLMPLPLTALDNVLAAGLENINFGGHPLLTTLSMGLLENFDGKFNYYRDCCSPATARAAAVMEEERQAIGRSLGLSLMSELAAMNKLYGLHETSVFELNRSSDAHSKITNAPNSPNHRYVSEDVPYLLVPIQELARMGGVPTPMIDACITITNAYNQTDYALTGRDAESMGLAGLTLAEMLASVHTEPAAVGADLAIS
ncbi:NAD/NADP octopine/nopaline dehydrogenase family protein [Arthrobacter sp. LAPM80]|uniref:NAD/NADP octopine/nopaline dehydrogenase family protein n=1 Tax=Arthrobacter sp. LAPM80 TaxID=3141788 RepID=UPI00398BAEEC